MATEEALIDVGDENEEAVEIELDEEGEENPNVVDQLDAVPEEDTEEEPKKDERSPEEKIQEYLESDPALQEHYSRSVQKRIDKLTFERHEAERQRDAATEYAQGVQKENVGLKSKQQQQDGVFINEHKGRLEAQMDAAKNQYKEAIANGDPELIAEANAQVSMTAAELSQAKQTETRFERFVKTTPTPEENFVPYSPEPAQETQQPQQPQPDAKAESWAEKNEWFGEDREMTNAALTIHQQLVTTDGYLPSSDAYYTELDSRIRKNYPTKFTKPKLETEQAVTAPGSGNTPAKPRGKKHVKLSASQVAVAKKLGVPLEEYAKYV